MKVCLSAVCLFASMFFFYKLKAIGPLFFYKSCTNRFGACFQHIYRGGSHTNYVSAQEYRTILFVFSVAILQVADYKIVIIVV